MYFKFVSLIYFNILRVRFDKTGILCLICVNFNHLLNNVFNNLMQTKYFY